MKSSSNVKSYSRQWQDVSVVEYYGLVDSKTSEKQTVTPRFFIDFGAGNGISGSNTYMLEQSFGWKGVCIETSPALFDSLRANRPRAICAENRADIAGALAAAGLPARIDYLSLRSGDPEDDMRELGEYVFGFMHISRGNLSPGMSRQFPGYILARALEQDDEYVNLS